jgi:NAD(P)H-dependent flavin oxidoreductase YrpB (nitropropane dioxygenase family)
MHIVADKSGKELVDVIIESVSASSCSVVGVLPKPIIDRLPAAETLYMNMVGHRMHVDKACNARADVILERGCKARSHSGNRPAIVLTTACRYLHAVQIAHYGKEVGLGATQGVYNGKCLTSALVLDACIVSRNQCAGGGQETTRSLCSVPSITPPYGASFPIQKLFCQLATPHVVDNKKNR